MVSSKLTKTPQSIRVGSLLKRSTLKGPCQVGMTVPQTAIWDDPGRFLRSASHCTIQAESLASRALDVHRHDDARPVTESAR